MFYEPINLSVIIMDLICNMINWRMICSEMVLKWPTGIFGRFEMAKPNQNLT